MQKFKTLDQEKIIHLLKYALIREVVGVDERNEAINFRAR